MWKKWTIGIIKKDWLDNHSTFLILIVASLIVQFLPDEQTRKECMAGVTLGAGYAYVYYGFTMERVRRMLPMVLGLPVPPTGLILAKLASIYSMCLVTVVVPGIMMLDLRALYLYTAEVLCVATAGFACSIFLRNQFAPGIPLLLIALAFKPQGSLQGLEPHFVQIATGGLLLIPVVVLISVLEFRSQAAV